MNDDNAYASICVQPPDDDAGNDMLGAMALDMSPPPSNHGTQLPDSAILY